VKTFRIQTKTQEPERCEKVRQSTTKYRYISGNRKRIRDNVGIYPPSCGEPHGEATASKSPSSSSESPLTNLDRSLYGENRGKMCVWFMSVLSITSWCGRRQGGEPAPDSAPEVQIGPAAFVSHKTQRLTICFFLYRTRAVAGIGSASSTRRPDTQRWVLPDGRHAFSTCFRQLLLPFSLLPIAPFWYFRELRTSLITRSFVLLCIPCWLPATRTRSICFFFCLLRLMYWYLRPQRFRWYLLP
jgi:hypothetical protein